MIQSLMRRLLHASRHPGADDTDPIAAGIAAEIDALDRRLSELRRTAEVERWGSPHGRQVVRVPVR